MDKDITKEFIKWLEEKDRQNWEIERFVEGLLADQKQQLLEKIRGIIKNAETEDCRECSGGKLTKDYVLDDIKKITK